jgi:small-conductance mechanosensitive channel
MTFYSAIFCILQYGVQSVYAIDSPASATKKASVNAFTKLGDVVGNTFEALEDKFETSINHYSAFAGKIFPILSKLYISPEKARQIVTAINIVQEPGDWIFIFLLGWATIPVIKYPYEKLAIGSSEATKKPFKDTLAYHFALHLSQAGKIAALVYGLDCVAIALQTMGFKDATQYSPYLAKAIYTLWIFMRFNALKQYLVFKAFGVASAKEREDLGKRGPFARAKIVNKILDILCLAACFFVMVDVLKVKSGVTLNSLFAVGGAGTVVLSLAVKDIVSEIVSGLALQASDKVYEGEKVMFGNGLKGHVDQIGLFETLIRDSSEMVTAVPNKELSNQRLTNISRNKFSQVKQAVHFEYEDLDKLPVLMDEIKREIKNSCPVVVTDGSKPFRVYFHEYAHNFLKVVVDVRMNVVPDSSSYYHHREQVLLAIGRAVKRMKIKFSVLSE